MDTKPGQEGNRLTPPTVRRALREIGEDVAAWRKLRGLTQKQLADRAGIARTTLHRLEHGDSIGTEQLLRILRALGVLDGLSRALDPYESAIGRLRSEERLPQRVRPRSMSSGSDD
jgi:transcriptional regulator with XRE-family HTH domain